MTAYAGIDLHSNNIFLGVLDHDNKKLFNQRLPNRLSIIKKALQPFKKAIAGIVVESTYNWYWLVDGLQEAGYKMHLANPAATKQYEGIKHTDDKSDAFWLAQMLLLGILPEGYIYPKAQRDIRDLFRRRLLYVRQRTDHILSFKSMVSRSLGKSIPANTVKKLMPEDARNIFDQEALALAGSHAIATINFLGSQIKSIEKQVIKHVKLKPEFKPLLTMPGIGNILAMTIMLEVGDIGRFPKAGNYASYCRCVKSEKISNKKKKGSGNRKNGNKYLAWAYVEAAYAATRHYPKVQRFYDRKVSRTNKIVARKALANKLARASFYVIRDQVGYQEDKMFPI
jgi:transposase